MKYTYRNPNRPMQRGQAFDARPRHERIDVLRQELDRARQAIMRLRHEVTEEQDEEMLEVGPLGWAYDLLEDIRDEVALTLNAYPRRRRIALLRRTKGCTPEESAARLAKADELESR